MNDVFYSQNDMEGAELSSKSQILKAHALSLGFFACGIAKAGPVSDDVAQGYRNWIASGGHADMNYLANNIDKRLDPTLLLEGAKSIIVVAMNYAPAQRIPADQYQLAVYAYGKDYHDVMKAMLSNLECRVKSIGVQANTEAVANSTLYTLNSKLATDTVPILERYWAQQAGVGFIGRNHQLIIPHAGSMFFLGEIITTAEFDKYDSPMKNRCGTCHRCIEACPTGALQMDDGRWKMEDGYIKFQTSNFKSQKCLSYQTIENRGEIDDQLKDKLGNTIYGCDRCQQICPWNRFATPTEIPELQPSSSLLNMTREKWQHLSVEEFRELFRGSAVKRAKYEGLMRNIQAVEEN